MCGPERGIKLTRLVGQATAVVLVPFGRFPRGIVINERDANPLQVDMSRKVMGSNPSASR